MGKVLQEFKKYYRTINIVVLCICLYLLILFPFVSLLLENISPTLTKCPYLALTGKPCPLCGGTRFLQNIKNAFYDIHYVFNIFGLIVLIMIIEIIFRTMNLRKKENFEKIIKWDIIIHCLLFICYIIYSMFFIFKS